MSSDKAVQRHVPLLATARVNQTRCLIQTGFIILSKLICRGMTFSYSFWLFVEVEHFLALVRMEGSLWWPLLSALSLVEILTVFLRDLALERDVRVCYIWAALSKIIV